MMQELHKIPYSYVACLASSILCVCVNALKEKKMVTSTIRIATELQFQYDVNLALPSW